MPDTHLVAHTANLHSRPKKWVCRQLSCFGSTDAAPTEMLKSSLAQPPHVVQAIIAFGADLPGVVEATRFQPVS
jgi:hypothetical protein